MKDLKRESNESCTRCEGARFQEENRESADYTEQKAESSRQQAGSRKTKAQIDFFTGRDRKPICLRPGSGGDISCRIASKTTLNLRSPPSPSHPRRAARPGS